MPFKSKAQRRKFAQLLVEGKITDEQYEEWNRSTGRKALPERVGSKGATTKRARKTAARTSSTGKAVAKRPARKPPARRKTVKAAKAATSSKRSKASK
jgi:hypothetical protein